MLLSWKFGHKWISEYIQIKKCTRTNIRTYFYNNFCRNECPNKYSSWKLYEYSNMFEYSSSFYTLTHWRTNVRIYSYKQIWYEWMSEYIRKRKIDTNECPNIYSWSTYSNIWIFEYIGHEFRSYQFFLFEYIRTLIRIKFVCTNIFGHSFVSVLECKN